MTAPNRATALITGARFYRALRPCVNGHEPVRYTAGCGCVGCHKARARGLLQSIPRRETKLFTSKKPCRRGHRSPQRYVSSRACVRCCADRRAGTLQPIKPSATAPKSNPAMAIGAAIAVGLRVSLSADCASRRQTNCESTVCETRSDSLNARLVSCCYNVGNV
jgi:hypothetical protein